MSIKKYINSEIIETTILLMTSNDSQYRANVRLSVTSVCINESNDIKKYTIGRKKQWKSLEPPKTISIFKQKHTQLFSEQNPITEKIER